MTEPLNNLQTKFTALELLLTTQHVALMQQLATLNTNVQGVTDAINALQLTAPEIDLSGIISRLDTAQAQRGSQVNLQTDIRNAIGAISQYPENYTVKRLLALLNIALNGDIPPVDADLAPDPSGQCGDSGYIRATSWAQGRAFNHGGVDVVEWFPMFPGYTTLANATQTGANSAPAYNRQPVSSGHTVMNVFWNYSQAVKQPIYAGKVWTYDSPPNAQQQIIPNLPEMNAVQGAFSESLKEVAGMHAGQYKFLSFALYFAPSMSPAINVWACYDGIGVG